MLSPAFNSSETRIYECQRVAVTVSILKVFHKGPKDFEQEKGEGLHKGPKDFEQEKGEGLQL